MTRRGFGASIVTPAPRTTEVERPVRQYDLSKAVLRDALAHWTGEPSKGLPWWLVALGVAVLVGRG